MGADFKLLSRLFVDKRARNNRVSFYTSWQWNRSVNFRMSSFSSVHNFQGTLIKDSMIIGFHSDSNDFFLCTCQSSYSVGVKLSNSKPATHVFAGAKGQKSQGRYEFKSSSQLRQHPKCHGNQSYRQFLTRQLIIPDFHPKLAKMKANWKQKSASSESHSISIWS